MKHIIKKILKEEFENSEWVNQTKTPFHEWMIKNYPELVNTVGLFLKDYENLEPQHDEDRISYVDQEGERVFCFYPDDEENNYCYFKFYGFWDVLIKEYRDIKPILKEWLRLTYNLGGLEPWYFHQRESNY